MRPRWIFIASSLNKSTTDLVSTDNQECCFPFVLYFRIYSLCGGGNSLWKFQIGLYYILVRSPPPSLPLNPLSTQLKAITRDFFVLFHIGIWSPSTIYPHLNSFIHPPPSHRSFKTGFYFVWTHAWKCESILYNLTWTHTITGYILLWTTDYECSTWKLHHTS
jgi:hypothetical protein